MGWYVRKCRSTPTTPEPPHEKDAYPTVPTNTAKKPRTWRGRRACVSRRLSLSKSTRCSNPFVFLFLRLRARFSAASQLRNETKFGQSACAKILLFAAPRWREVSKSESTGRVSCLPEAKLMASRRTRGFGGTPIYHRDLFSEFTYHFLTRGKKIRYIACPSIAYVPSADMLAVRTSSIESTLLAVSTHTIPFQR